MEDYYVIRLQVCSKAYPASSVLKDYVGSSDALDKNAPHLIFRPLKNTSTVLGDCSLRTDCSIFWILGESMYVDISRRQDPSVTKKVISTGGGMYSCSNFHV
jgi:hypothetical protein